MKKEGEEGVTLEKIKEEDIFLKDYNFSLNENVILRNKPQVICWLESQALLSFRDSNSASTFFIIPSN